MKMRKIGRILTVMFLTGGLMTGCQKKQTVVLPEKEQKEEATETESKNKETQEISFDEELPKDYEGTLTIPTTIRRLHRRFRRFIQMSHLSILPLNTKTCPRNMRQH